MPVRIPSSIIPRRLVCLCFCWETEVASVEPFKGDEQDSPLHQYLLDYTCMPLGYLYEEIPCMGSVGTPEVEYSLKRHMGSSLAAVHIHDTPASEGSVP